MYNGDSNRKRGEALWREIAFPFDFLLLDEPFTGLDEENRKKLEEYFLSRQKKRSVIFASHEDPLLWKDYGKVYL